MNDDEGNGDDGPEDADDDEPTGALVCQYVRASGRAYDDCVILGRRFLDGIGPIPDETDYWVLINEPGPDETTLTHTRWAWKNFLTGIWRSPSGRVYVSDGTLAGVHVFFDVMDLDQPPVDYLLPDGAAPEGIWGLSDECVFTWGTRMDAQRNKTYPVFRFDGKVWHELPSPGRPVEMMHGIAPDLVYAVGWGGLIARWNGAAWTEFPAPTREILTDVHVETWDELYAVGGQGIFLEGSASGWGFAGSNPLGPVPFASVAKYQGEVYLGAQGVGLMKRAAGGGAIEEFKPNIAAGHMEVRENLIITCRSELVGTSDNVSFYSSAEDMLYELTNAIGVRSL
jgi:hypothetical protein